MDAEQPFRWILALVLISGIGISGYHRRKARQSGETIRRSAESPGLIAGRLALGLPLLLAFVLYLIDPRWMMWSRVELPVAWRWAGAVIGLATVGLIYAVVSSLGSNISETVLTKQAHELVTRGPYRRVRHPLYSSGILLIVAGGLLMANGVVLGLAVLVALAIVRVVIPREEAQLIAKFGDRYVDYQAGTGRLLPRLRGGGRARS